MEKQAVIRWLDTFSESVRKRDYVRGKSLFSDGVVSFGSWTTRMSGVDALHDQQWSNVWPVTTDFEFGTAEAELFFDQSSCPTQCVVTSLWSSQGLRNNKTFGRTGRCTIVLRKDEDVWLAIHTHFSLAPSDDL